MRRAMLVRPSWATTLCVLASLLAFDAAVRGADAPVVKIPTDGRGVMALCRLVRFETSNQLSKQAALLIMNRKEPADKEARAQLARLISAGAGLSKRSGAQWLKVYANTLENPIASLPTWERLA